MGYGITFNGKHSFDDLGLLTFSKEIGTPSKNKIKDSVPFMNGSYDFSNIYNGSTYSERELTFVFKTSGGSRTDAVRMVVENWLMGTDGQVELIEDDLKSYYYLAECIDLSFEEFNSFGKLIATFTAYPFKIGVALEGSKILWDEFCFDTDALQETEFEVSGTKEVVITNLGIVNVTPIIECDSVFKLIKDNNEYTFSQGETKDYRLELSPGANAIVIKGNGNISIKFRKEII